MWWDSPVKLFSPGLSWFKSFILLYYVSLYYTAIQYPLLCVYACVFVFLNLKGFNFCVHKRSTHRSQKRASDPHGAGVRGGFSGSVTLPEQFMLLTTELHLMGGGIPHIIIHFIL